MEEFIEKALFFYSWYQPIVFLLCTIVSFLLSVTLESIEIRQPQPEINMILLLSQVDLDLREFISGCPKCGSGNAGKVQLVFFCMYSHRRLVRVDSHVPQLCIIKEPIFRFQPRSDRCEGDECGNGGTCQLNCKRILKTSHNINKGNSSQETESMQRLTTFRSFCSSVYFQSISYRISSTLSAN